MGTENERMREKPDIMEVMGERRDFLCKPLYSPDLVLYKL